MEVLPPSQSSIIPHRNRRQPPSTSDTGQRNTLYFLLLCCMFRKVVVAQASIRQVPPVQGPSIYTSTHFCPRTDHVCTLPSSYHPRSITSEQPKPHRNRFPPPPASPFHDIKSILSACKRIIQIAKLAVRNNHQRTQPA